MTNARKNHVLHMSLTGVGLSVCLASAVFFACAIFLGDAVQIGWAAFCCAASSWWTVCMYLHAEACAGRYHSKTTERRHDVRQ